jgi:hypothetical protein
MRNKKALPFCPMAFIQREPAVECGLADVKLVAELLHGNPMTVIHQNSSEDEKKCVESIRDDGIRKDGMRMAAGADHPHHTKLMFLIPALKGIDDVPEIVCMNPAVALPFAEGADLLLREE